MKREEHKIKVAVIGCGLAGQKRIEAIRSNKQSKLEMAVDISEKLAKQTARKQGCAWETDWYKAVHKPDIDAVVISTPHHLLCTIAGESLRAGKHVLVEKPMARNVSEALRIFEYVKKTGRKFKVGYNLRYHPAIRKAHKYFRGGLIGKPVNIRAQYGHGGRQGYEKEWRGEFELCGGGELTDQGVHIIDLIQWFCGTPSEIFACLQTAVWPIAPSEDNGFVLMKYGSGIVANFHCSWTQWKNLFNFEIFGEKGTLIVNGLGGSYGGETLTTHIRNMKGGPPKVFRETFNSKDNSWNGEWDDFVSGICKNSYFMSGAKESLSVLKTLNAVYQSDKQKKIVSL